MIKAEPLQVAHVHSFDMPVDDDSVGTGEAAVAQVDYLVGVAARVQVAGSGMDVVGLRPGASLPEAVGAR